MDSSTRVAVRRFSWSHTSRENIMRLNLTTGLITVLLVSGCAVTPPPKTETDLAGQPPEGSLAATASIQAAPMSSAVPDAFQRQLQAMEAIHQKIHAARTPARRAALLDEQMKLMQAGMAMMAQMRGATPAGAEGIPAMGDMMGMQMQMERRMAMTEQMVQMMMDRLSVPATPPANASTKRQKTSK